MSDPWYRVAERLFAGRAPREGDAPPAPVNELVIVDLTGPADGVRLPSVFAAARRIEHPIPDFATPPPEQVEVILDDIDDALADQAVVLVHCRAGIGRTGVVVGCWLVRHGLDGGDALARLAELRSVLGRDAPRSPETASQRALVASWIRPDAPAGG